MCCVAAITAQKQGSYDPKSPWSQARYQQFQQHRLRLGRVAFSKLAITEQLNPAFQGMQVSATGTNTTHIYPHARYKYTHTHATTSTHHTSHAFTHNRNTDGSSPRLVGLMRPTPSVTLVAKRAARTLADSLDSRAAPTASCRLMAPCRRNELG